VPENGAREIHNYAADVSNRRSKNTIWTCNLILRPRN
jgi:hypothetical protein